MFFREFLSAVDFISSAERYFCYLRSLIVVKFSDEIYFGFSWDFVASVRHSRYFPAGSAYDPLPSSCRRPFSPQLKLSV